MPGREAAATGGGRRAICASLRTCGRRSPWTSLHDPSRLARPVEVQGVEQLDSDEAQARVAAGALLLDVREMDEWRQGRIPGSTLLPMSEIAARLADVPRDRPLVLVCRSGNRSHQVAAWLAAQGYDAANLMHGIQGWAHMGLPLESGAQA